MGITDKLGDDAFDDDGGMLARAKDLGDPGTTTGTTFSPNWIPGFKKDIHGMILVSGESHQTVAEVMKKIESIFKLEGPEASIRQVIKIVGDVRPGKEKGHEQFVSSIVVTSIVSLNYRTALASSMASRSQRSQVSIPSPILARRLYLRASSSSDAIAIPSRHVPLGLWTGACLPFATSLSLFPSLIHL